MTSATELALWTLIALPAMSGAGLLLATLCGRDLGRGAAAIAIAVSAGVLVLAIWVAAAKPAAGLPFMAGAEFSVQVDALAAVVVPAVAAVTLLVLVFASADRALAGGRFHGLMLLFASAAVLTATASSMPALLLAWEVMGAASYALIGFHWREETRVSSGLTAFITTRAADLGLYLAAGAALAGGAGLALADFPAADGGWRHLIALGVLVAALGKAAQLPFSFWLSKAMQGPSPVSALLHSAAMVAMGTYLLLRSAPLLAATGWAATAAVWVGAVTAVLLGVVAVAQRDLKQLLAASTSAQLGFVVMAAGLATVSGGAAQLIAHAWTKAGLFLAAGVWLSLLGSQRLDMLRGAARRWPLVGATATVSALALAGVAPLSLWATKDAVLAAAHERSPWLYGLGLMAAVLSAAYAAKIIMVVWWTGIAPDDAAAVEQQPRNPLRLSALEKVPLVVLALGAAGAGALALPPISTWLGRSLDGAQPAQATIVELTVSAALAVVIVLTVMRWGTTEPRWALNWLGLERTANAVLVRPTQALAATLARFDDHVLDRGIDAAATGTMKVAGHAGRVDIHRVDAAVETVAARVRDLGELARKPQTGQLHQYYAMIVAVLALGVLLLLAVR
ncbi:MULTISPECIES: proton-conducting transporter membrane subunit [Mycobacteriaceae]|uniref:proton-conducting transporter transmembrane domain-containing protein n=1 Tax=Mycobacteriaceae TaxID=1762 RepID=UPI001CD9F115|nr:proton-conducting transporter membrane subunit [Mycobacterium sp. WUMAC-067]MCA2243377.1 NADH-quinone oxidoreductase subunit L [Mycobacterium sp. WUMAC-067]